MSLKRFYNKKMKIRRLSYPTQDSIGGIIQTKSAETVANCSVRLLSAQERVISGRDGVESTHRIYCPYQTKINAKDIVRIDEEEFDVNYVWNPIGATRFKQVEATLRS